MQTNSTESPTSKSLMMKLITTYDEIISPCYKIYLKVFARCNFTSSLISHDISPVLLSLGNQSDICA